MNRYKYYFTIASFLILPLFSTGCGVASLEASVFAKLPTSKSASTVQTRKNPVPAKSSPRVAKEQLIDWNKPSGGPYPTLTKGEEIWIDVSIHDQKIYIKNGNETIYTMVTSSGLDTTPDNTTPTGTFYVQAERGTWFYTPQYKEGAEYWVSWKNHGEFLFHSVPMDKNHKVIVEDAKKLGQKDSHGCFHLTIPDAKWIYDHIPVKTKVVIHE
jgi:lipoprotein-anchoring transpeptidase ErfK/SrfK